MSEVENLLMQQGLDYKVSGADLVVLCLNPEHDDSNPSMRIDSNLGIFRCPSCGFKGNIFNHFGAPINYLQMRRNRLKSKIQLKISENIGLEMPPNCIPFEQEWRDISADTYKHFEAFQTSESDLIGRVVFPIRNIKNNIVVFVGRHLTGEDPKYKNFPVNATMPLFPKPDLINGRVILVEGFFDFLNLWDKGLRNAVVNWGVDSFRLEDLRLLKVLGVRGIDIFFDPDKAGELGAKKVKAICEQNEMSTRDVSYGAKDPGELTQTEVNKLKGALYD